MMRLCERIVRKSPAWVLVSWATLISIIVTTLLNSINLSVGKYEKIGNLSLDGIITSIIAVIGLALIFMQIRISNDQIRINNKQIMISNKQIEISNKQIEQNNRIFRFNRFEKRVSNVLKNIQAKNVREGCMVFSDNQSCNYFVAWKLGTNDINILIRITKKDDNIDDIIKSLKNTKDTDRWNCRFLVSFDVNFESEVFQKNINGESVEFFDEYDYLCVSHALMNLQQADKEEIKECRKFLKKNKIRKAIDEFIESPIIGKSIKLQNTHS